MRTVVYVETSVPSFYYEVRTDPDMVARRDWTRAWWSVAADRHDLVTSPAVIDELERGDYPCRAECLALIGRLPVPLCAKPGDPPRVAGEER
jgi:hypothetical protein